MEYKFDEEKLVALHFADRLDDARAKKIIEEGSVSSSQEATYLSKFFWKMVDKSVDDEAKKLPLPCDGGAEFWTEKLLNSFGGYLERVGFEVEWDNEIDNA